MKREILFPQGDAKRKAELEQEDGPKVEEVKSRREIIGIGPDRGEPTFSEEELDEMHRRAGEEAKKQKVERLSARLKDLDRANELRAQLGASQTEDTKKEYEGVKKELDESRGAIKERNESRVSESLGDSRSGGQDQEPLSPNQKLRKAVLEQADKSFNDIEERISKRMDFWKNRINELDALNHERDLTEAETREYNTIKENIDLMTE